MLRMIVTASLMFVTSILLVFPVIEIERVPAGGSCGAPGSAGCSIVSQVHEELKAVETVASAFAQAAVSGIRTLVCLGETTVEIYKVLSGPAPDERA